MLIGTLLVSLITGIGYGAIIYNCTDKTLRSRVKGLISVFFLLLASGYFFTPDEVWKKLVPLYPTSLGFFFIFCCGGHIIKFKKEIFPSYFFNKHTILFRILGILLIILGIFIEQFMHLY